MAATLGQVIGILQKVSVERKCLEKHCAGCLGDF